MYSNEKISTFLMAHGIVMSGPLVRDNADESRVYAFINAKKDHDGKRSPSNYFLKKISDALLLNGIVLTFVISGEIFGNVEEVVRSVLLVSFNDAVRNAFVSSCDGRVLIWVEPKRVLNSAEEEGIQRKCIDLVKVLDLPLDAIHFTSSENIPTRTACLKSIRLHAPISKDELSKVLSKSGFHIPGGDWLPRMLDGLRKAGLVLRRKDGGFVLTYVALMNLGSAKGSKSPDVGRALDLVRRRH